MPLWQGYIQQVPFFSGTQIQGWGKLHQLDICLFYTAFKDSAETILGRKETEDQL